MECYTNWFLAQIRLVMPLSRHVIHSPEPLFLPGLTCYKKSIYLLYENMKNMINKQDLVLYMLAQLGTVSSQHQQSLIIPGEHTVITGHITFNFLMRCFPIWQNYSEIMSVFFGCRWLHVSTRFSLLLPTLIPLYSWLGYLLYTCYLLHQFRKIVSDGIRT